MGIRNVLALSFYHLKLFIYQTCSLAHTYINYKYALFLFRAPETNIEQVNQSREAQLKRQQQRQEQLAQQRMISEEQKRQELIRKQQEQQEFLKQQKDQEIRTQKLRETEPSESSVHGKEVCGLIVLTFGFIY